MDITASYNFLHQVALSSAKKHLANQVQFTPVARSEAACISHYFVDQLRELPFCLALRYEKSFFGK